MWPPVMEQHSMRRSRISCGELRELVAAEALQVGGRRGCVESRVMSVGVERCGWRSEALRQAAPLMRSRAPAYNIPGQGAQCRRRHPGRVEVRDRASGQPLRPPAGRPRCPADRRRWTWPAAASRPAVLPSSSLVPVASSTSSAIWNARPMSSPKAVSAASCAGRRPAAMPPSVQAARISAPVLPRWTSISSAASASAARPPGRATARRPCPRCRRPRTARRPSRPRTAGGRPSSSAAAGEHARRDRHQEEAGPGGGRHIEGAVGGGAAAAEVVVVHARQVVVHQRVGVHRLDRGRDAGDGRATAPPTAR